MVWFGGLVSILHSYSIVRVDCAEESSIIIIDITINIDIRPLN